MGLAKFTPNKKKKIITENEKHFGCKTCEKCFTSLVDAKKSEKGVTPPPNEVQVDHIDPESKGGPATEENGQLVCRKCNREDSNKKKENYKQKNRGKKDAC